jgi:uncharacterized protein (UPF0332 family)
MRHEQVLAEWRRAQKALRAAELLHQHGLSEDAISRAYYAIMHAAKASLLVHGVVAESHAAVRRLCGQVLVMTEGLEREWAQILARSHDQRGAAEYNVDFEVDEGAAERLVRDAQRFVERLASYVISTGIRLETRDDEGEGHFRLSLEP